MQSMPEIKHLINKPKIYWAAYPFALIYGGIVHFRNKCFDWGWLKSEEFDTPTICIGNISVGGTGKTPHTEYLIRLLQKDHKVAVLSRGYKRKSEGFQVAKPDSGIEDIGDEPLQMFSKFGDITVAVDRDRRNGIRLLMNMPDAPEVVLLDDAYQHRYVRAGLNLLLIDSHRPICYDRMLPAGRLREAADGQRRADIIIVTKCGKDMNAEKMEAYRQTICPLPYQKLFFTRFEYADLYELDHTDNTLPLNRIDKDTHILLLTGIASPAPIIEELKLHTEHIVNLPFADHHDFTATDIEKVERTFNALPDGQRMIVTTEKDATRLHKNKMLNGKLKESIYILPITVDFLNNKKTEFDACITNYVEESKKKI